MTVLAKNPERFVETKIEDETVVMSLDTGSFYSMQGTASHIWQLLDDGISREVLIDRLAEAYARPSAEIIPEVEAFIATLQSAGFLQEA